MSTSKVKAVTKRVNIMNCIVGEFSHVSNHLEAMMIMCLVVPRIISLHNFADSCQYCLPSDIDSHFPFLIFFHGNSTISNAI